MLGLSNKSLLFEWEKGEFGDGFVLIVKEIDRFPYLISNLVVLFLLNHLFFEGSHHIVPFLLAFLKFFLGIGFDEWREAALNALKFSFDLDGGHAETILSLWISCYFLFYFLNVELLKLLLSYCKIPQRIAYFFYLLAHYLGMFIEHSN